MAPTSSYQRNWLPDNHSGMAVVSDPAKQATTTNHKRPASSSSASLIDSAYNSPSSTIESVHPPSTNQQNSSLRPKRLNNNNSSSSSQGRSSRTTTASLKEYGECYRRLAEGTSAVVMVVRKLGKDGRNEKLYAIKQFRKRSKNETEKEYMKKLTSEFCISSTFSHPNVVQTIDLVLDDRKRYCTVMEYVSSSINKNKGCHLLTRLLIKIVSRWRPFLVHFSRAHDGAWKAMLFQANDAGSRLPSFYGSCPPRHEAREPAAYSGRTIENYGLWCLGCVPISLGEARTQESRPCWIGALYCTRSVWA